MPPGITSTPDGKHHAKFVSSYGTTHHWIHSKEGNNVKEEQWTTGPNHSGASKAERTGEDLDHELPERPIGAAHHQNRMGAHSIINGKLHSVYRSHVTYDDGRHVEGKQVYEGGRRTQ